MSNFYVLVSHYEPNGRDKFYLDVQLLQKELSIGWGELNPIGLNYDQVHQLILKHYPQFEGTTNPDNGAKSLPLFCDFAPGDIVFVRGDAKIIDVVVITSFPYYDEENGHEDGDYCLKASFTPLFNDKHSTIRTIDLNDIYNAVLYEGGYTLVVREISSETAKQLLLKILKIV
jgi:hypothetical protein